MKKEDKKHLKLIEESLTIRGDYWVAIPIGKELYRGEIVVGTKQIPLCIGYDIQEVFYNLENEILRLSKEEYIPSWDCDQTGNDKKYYNSKEWLCRCILIMREQKGKCYDCKKYNIKDVHHLTYDRLYMEPLTDLVGLCGYCHLERHDLPMYDDRPIEKIEIDKNKIYTKAEMLKGDFKDFVNL